MRTRGINFTRMSNCAALLLGTLCLLAGCNNAVSTPLRVQDSAEEIRSAIGAHSPGRPNVSELIGQSVMRNMWGFQSCRWMATTAQQIQGFPNGWFDKIELKVFDQDRTSWARKEAKGEAVKGLGDGAMYDATNGQLWFNCGRGQFCILNADTANSERREQLARSLAQSLAKRLQ